MATFAEVLEKFDDLVYAAPDGTVANSAMLDKRAAWATMLSEMIELANGLQRRAALLTLLVEQHQGGWQRAKWEHHLEATLELMNALGIKPVAHENDLMV